MNKSGKRETTRERRERFKRSTFITHILISIVALIECLVLLSFTTYSWIESSSSLIISTGKGGVEGSMAVAKNLFYQVHVSSDAAGNVQLVAQEGNRAADDTDGYFRTVRHYSYAKTSSNNGKDFFFKKSDGTANYRLGDTADYNTTYTYLDFEVRNTTGTEKEFCFAGPEIFTYDGDANYKDAILNAMRISFQKNSGTPKIVSLTGTGYNPVNSTDGSVTSSAITPDTVESHVYDKDSPTQNPLFTSDPNGAEECTDKISIRIWFEEKDAHYSDLSQNEKDAFDRAMFNAKIGLNFSLISDNIDYGVLYFDDYAFSSRTDAAGSFVTREESSYKMYLHVVHSEQGAANYVMSRTANSDNDADRWVVSVPIPYVVDDGTNHYLTSTSSTQWSEAYFYYGTSDPSTALYKWNFSDLADHLEIETVSVGGNDVVQIKEKTSYFRNLGVVRSSAQQAQDNGPIEGFLQYDRNNTNADKNADPMQLVYLRDRATALTGQPYNASDTANNVLNYQYITNSATGTYDITKTITTETPGSSSGGTTKDINYSTLINAIKQYNQDHSGSYTLYETDLDNLDRISYFDVPSGWNIIFHSYDNTDYKTSSTNMPRATDGTCYYVGNFNGTSSEQSWQTEPDFGYGSAGNTIKLNSTYLPKLNSSDGYVRVYFYKTTQLDGTGNNKWGNNKRVKISRRSYNNDASLAWYDERYGITIVSGENTTQIVAAKSILDEDTSYTEKGTSSSTVITEEEVQYSRYNGGVYLNLHNENSYESSAKKTVSMYYDAGAELFKAYVPRSWLSSGYDVHYNQLQGYYSLGSDELRWSTGEAVRTDPGYVYTVLGYSEANTLSGLAAGAVGVGTWDNVRRMAYSTELLNLTSGGSMVYKTGVSSALYPMVPDLDDDLHFTYWAYVPESGLASQSTNHALRFARYDSYSSSPLSGVWYPQENITYKETTYYAADSTATDDNSASTAKRGWFHVAVFVDGTFENIVYDTLYNAKAVNGNGAKLEYSIDNGSTYQSIVTTSVSGSSVTANESADMFKIGNTRWVVPIGADSRQVKFRWTPYSGTQFDYNVNTEVGFYCVVTESATSY